jgi:hypothetical protein
MTQALLKQGKNFGDIECATGEDGTAKRISTRMVT